MTEWREDHESYTLVFRQPGDEKCTRETATEVRVKGHHYTNDVWLPWPASQAIIKVFGQVAEGAYGRGKQDAQAAFRSALGFDDAVREMVNYDALAN